MHGKNSYEDELARRRRLRDRQSAMSRVSDEPVEGAPAEEEELPRFGWKDIFAMCIAAYQIIFPILLLLIGVMVVVFLLFRWYFGR